MFDKELRVNDESRRIYLSGLIEKLNSKKESLKILSKSYSNYRLLLLVIEVFSFFILLFIVSNLAALISVIIFLIALSVIAHFHNKLDRGIKKFELWIKIKKTNLARLNLDWQNIPLINYTEEETQFHSFSQNEIDLNIAGEESLHQLINTGTSVQSKSLLRKWLNSKNPYIPEILERQHLIGELIPLTGFRDKLVLYSTLSSRPDFDGKMILKLLNKKDTLPRFFKLIFALLIILAPLNVLLFLLFLEKLIPAFWGVTTVAYISLFYLGNKQKEKLLDEAEYISDELEKITGVFKLIEDFKFKKDSYLFRLCEAFKTNEHPSALVSKIKNAVGFLRIRKGNPFVWNVIRVIFPIDLLFRLKLKKYKNLVSDNFENWLESWYKLEALSSLANFASLNPGYSFPAIIESAKNQLTFNSKKLGHPLIKKEKKICNDFAFDPAGEISIITGSNMSGKSTFIRTLGINLSLAYAGSVVNAGEFKISQFNLFTCIKVSDSVIDGISYFYAEVKRLKSLLDEIEKSQYPIFFLIDEIFRGTNNVERLTGSSAFIKKLAGTVSAGAIATHDLELVKLADEISRVKNYHFKEEIKDGKMIFDYKLNNGPCPTTNALKIMKLEGLPVE